MEDAGAGYKARTTLPVWVLIAALAAISGALWWYGLRPLGAVDDALDVPWWVVALGFATVEAFVVNLHFRSESGSFSLLEIPMVVGLLFVEPQLHWIAMILGAAASLAFIRRQPPIKVAFNAANLSVHVSVAALLFDALLGTNDALSPQGWLALFAATMISSLVQVVGISLVIGIAERQFSLGGAWNMVLFGWLVAGANTVQALIAVLLVVVEPLASVLLVGSTGMLFLAYRAYVSERDHRERVEFLYQSTRNLRESGESQNAVSVLLEEAASMFRAATAELVLFPRPDSDEEATAFAYRDGRTRQRQVSDHGDELERVVDLANEPFIVVPGACPAVVRSHLDGLGIGDALMGSLATDQRPIGLLIVGDRLGSVTTFTEEDLRLFENLVDQSAVAMENDQLEQALDRLRELEGELSRQARYDLLTGLANRNLFTTRLEELVKTASPGEITLLYVDLDDFKLVNDQLGHASGDGLLVEVAERLNEVVRPTDLCARLGGDEFIVMLVGPCDADVVARRIISSLSAPFLLGVDEVRIGASVGIAASEATSSAPELLHRADLAMYAAKQQGKGSVVWYTSDLQSVQSRQQALQTALRRAISDQEFEVVYQPIVRLEDQRMVGAEALVRWRRGAGEPLTPDRFLAEAERSGLIVPIDRIVRDIVMTDLPRISPENASPFFVTINVSARNLHQTDFVDEFARSLMAHDARSDRLVLELTESAFAGDADAVSERLASLRKLGVRVALDDFGTGYSSLSYLRELPIDFLKIAQPFISDLTGPNGKSFVDAINGLGRTLSLTVVAEGVEHSEQLRALQAIGCELGQGFLFARPMPKNELLWLRTNPRHRLGPAVETPAA